jgi:hypothetical protein
MLSNVLMKLYMDLGQYKEFRNDNVSGLPWSPGLSQLCSHVVDPGGAPVSESLAIEPPCAFPAPAPVVPDPIPDRQMCQESREMLQLIDATHFQTPKIT